MLELTRASRWLVQTLAADSALSAAVGGRIFDGPRQDAALPFVVVQYQGGYDVAGVGPTRILSQLVFIVKVIGKTASWTALQPAADRLDAVLHGASGVAADGRVLACTREAPFALIETDAGTEYRHLGGSYRVLAQPA